MAPPANKCAMLQFAARFSVRAWLILGKVTSALPLQDAELVAPMVKLDRGASVWAPGSSRRVPSFRSCDLPHTPRSRQPRGRERVPVNRRLGQTSIIANTGFRAAPEQHANFGFWWTWHKSWLQGDDAYPIPVHFNDRRACVCACERAFKRGQCGRAKRSQGDSSHPRRSNAPIERITATGCSE